MNQYLGRPPESFSNGSLNETVRLGRVKNLGGYLKHEESLERIELANRPTVSEKKPPPLT